MCGIAGYIGPRTLDPGTIETCLTLMKRRGPSASGHVVLTPQPGRNIHLLHTRLSIIDLEERANQPFRLRAKTLVYNGELYNYVELRRELESRGRSFSTDSDTEVLLAALDEFGEQALDRFEGMWAFCMYDAATDSAMLSRDRFGEKPLYTYRDETGFYFGSEVKFIARLRGRPFEVNNNHLYRYLVNGYKSLYKVEDTFFKGVKELPSSTVVTIDRDDREALTRYWHPQFHRDHSLSYSTMVERVRAALLLSVELRLRADVPIAFCMSGGVDSNTLISIAKRVFNYDVHGFTILNEDARYEEKGLVEQVVRDLQLKHTAVPIDGRDFLPNMRRLVRQHDAPVYTISYYVHWLLMSHIAREGYRISVSGTGADEVFTGYYDHHSFYLSEAKEQSHYGEALAAWRAHVAPFVRNPYLQDPEVFVRQPALRDHIFLDNAGFAGYLKKDWFEPFSEVTYTATTLRNRMLNEMFHEVVPVILHEDDLNSMYFSIENRSPFLDRRLFELTQGIPVPHLVRDGYAKAVLRDAMQGIVPDEVLWNHRKVGFNAPVLDLLDTSHPETRDWLLEDGPVFDHIRRDKVEALISKGALPNSESKFLFYFINTKMFLEEFQAA